MEALALSVKFPNLVTICSISLVSSFIPIAISLKALAIPKREVCTRPTMESLSSVTIDSRSRKSPWEILAILSSKLAIDWSVAPVKYILARQIPKAWRIKTTRLKIQKLAAKSALPLITKK